MQYTGHVPVPGGPAKSNSRFTEGDFLVPPFVEKRTAAILVPMTTTKPEAVSDVRKLVKHFIRSSFTCVSQMILVEAVTTDAHNARTVHTFPNGPHNVCWAARSTPASSPL